MTAQRTSLFGVALGLALVSAAILGASPSRARAAATPTDTATATPSSTPPPGQLTLQVSPTHGQVNQQITLLGQGFAPQTPLTIWLDSTSGALLETPTTDGSGHFSDTITLPAGASSGTHQLLADGGGQELAAVLYTVDATLAPCTGFTISIPLIGNVCIDISGLVNDVLAATFGSVAGLFGSAWDTLTSTFEPALINTPNFASDPTWTAFQQFVTVLQAMWMTLFVAMFVFGMFARYMEGIGAGSFQGILGHLGRATMLTALLALYNPIMANWVFPAENGLAQAIATATIPGTDGGLSLIGQAFQTVSSVFSLTALLNLLILLLALVLGVLCVVVRDMGLGVLAALYALGPLALATWLSPQLDFIARWCVRMMISVLLWPVGYALALKVGSALINASGWANSSAGVLGSLGALGCVVLLYRVPVIVGSMVGSDGISGAVLMVTDRAFVAAQSIATRALKGI
jgi:hypothetical protein